MNLVLQPSHLVTLFLASWINRQQQEVIEYLRTENAHGCVASQALHLTSEKAKNTLHLRQTRSKARIGKKRIHLNDDHRRRLVFKGKTFGRKVLDKVGTLFTPDTILRWLQKMIAAKRDYSDRKKKVGRPRVRQVFVDLTMQLPWGNGIITNYIARSVKTRSSKSVLQLLEIEEPNLAFLANGIRNLFVHGSLTPLPRKSNPNRVANICNALRFYCQRVR